MSPIYRKQTSDTTNPLDALVARARFTVMNAHTEQQRIDAINAGHVIGYLDCTIELVEGMVRVYKHNRLIYVPPKASENPARDACQWARDHF